MRNYWILFMAVGLFLSSCTKKTQTIWQIGEADNSSAEFALAPDNYENFIENDFGWEDKYFLVGSSDIKTDWPYVLPGPTDKWGGTWSTSGWRSHTLNILFGIEKLPKKEDWKLIIDLQDINTKDAPIFKVTINGKSWKSKLPLGSGKNSLEGVSPEELQKMIANPIPENEIKETGDKTDTENQTAKEFEHIIEIPIPKSLLKEGGNSISLTTIQGSWLIFDQVRLEGPGNAKLIKNENAFLRDVVVANYELANENAQPLIVDVEHISGTPELK